MCRGVAGELSFSCQCVHCVTGESKVCGRRMEKSVTGESNVLLPHLLFLSFFFANRAARLKKLLLYNIILIKFKINIHGLYYFLISYF